VSRLIQDARRLGYLVCARTSTTTRNRWAQICNRECIPDVRVEPSKVYARVTADIIQAGLLWPDAVQALMRRTLAQWAKRATVGHNFVHCKRVPVEQAEDVARYLSDAARTLAVRATTTRMSSREVAR
jgi:hypothetical protein